MSRITVQRPAARYTMIPNSVIRERKLSLRAVGLYCQLASLPPNATTSIRQLAEQHKEGKHAIQAAKDELIAAGLLTVEQVRCAFHSPDRNPLRNNHLHGLSFHCKKTLDLPRNLC